MTGFDGVSFTSLLQKFAPLFDDYTPFHTSHILLKLLIKLSQDYLVSAMPTRHEQRVDIQRKRQATSMRQAAEWGMRAIQSSFPRLKDTFVYEDTGERRILMKMVCLLYNLCARTVGINQINNVFMTHLDVNANNEMNMM